MFFHVLFLLTAPLRLEFSRSRKTASFLKSHGLKKYKNLHPQRFMNGSKNMANVENRQFLKEN